jgi:hypothetical protein
MALMNIEKINIASIGECLKISNGKISFTVACDIGPRIIELQILDKKSVFFIDSKDEINGADQDFSGYGDLGHWHLYGGHRLWASPEAPIRTAYPDNRPVSIEILDNGIKVTGEVQKNNHIQVSMTVLFVDDNKIEVTHNITNTNTYPINISAWPITVVAYGGFEAIKMPETDTGVLPNRHISLWSYSKMNDSRVCFGEKYITLKADENIDKAFKIGLKTELDYASYFTDDTLFIKRFDLKEGLYPDFDCNYETYTNISMLEMESLSPLQEIGYNQEITHKEIWELYDLESQIDPKNEKEIEKRLSAIS